MRRAWRSAGSSPGRSGAAACCAGARASSRSGPWACERYVLSEADRDLAHLDAKGWGKRPVRISLAVDPGELDSGVLLYTAFIVHQLAGDAATTASTGSVAATGAYVG